MRVENLLIPVGLLVCRSLWSPACNEPLKCVEFQQNLQFCVAQNGTFNGFLLWLFIRTLQLNLDSLEQVCFN